MSISIQRTIQLFRVAGAILFALIFVLLLALALHTPLRAAPTLNEPSTAAQTGSITGHVTASDGGDLEPLRVQAENQVTFSSTETLLDGAGFYTLTGLAAGAYRITFNTEEIGPYLPEFYNNRRDIDSYDPVTVTASATTSGIDAVLQLGGIINGQVTIAGTGAPIAGIYIIAFPVDVDSGQQRSATTDADGHYQIVGLYGGDTTVCFDPLDDSSELYLPSCYNNRAPGEERDPIHIIEGSAISNINASLLLGGMITGRVTSELTGKPLAGIPVDGERIGEPYHRQSVTDASGFYTITKLPTANYQVIFNSFSANYLYAEEFYNEKPTLASADSIAVTASMTTTGINEVLGYALSITGRVEVAGSHEPLSELRVFAYDTTGEFRRESYFVDDTGHYSITNLMPGSYRIRFGKDMFVRQYYSNQLLFEDADLVEVTTNTVATNINGSLTRRQATELAIASGDNRPNALVATRQGLFNPLYTLDNGQSWHTFATLPVPEFFGPPAIGVIAKDDPDQPVRFLLAPSDRAITETSGIYRTGDEGTTWGRYAPAIDPRCNFGSASNVTTIVPSPIDPLRAYAFRKCAGTVISSEQFTVLYWSLYTSADGGVTWQRVSLPLDVEYTVNNDLPGSLLLPSPVKPSRIYLQAQPFTYDFPSQWKRSDNNGQSWITETYTLSALALDWVDAAKLYGVEDKAGNNVFRFTGKRSVNSGANWVDWAQQPCRTSFQQLLSLPGANSLLMLCDQGIYRTLNGGDSWEKMNDQSGGTLAVHNGDHQVVLWMRGSELFESRDQGATWSDLGAQLESALPFISVHK